MGINIELILSYLEISANMNVLAFFIYMKTQSLSEKLALLNIAALESIEGGSEMEIICQYTQRAIDILGADFGHAWFKGPGAKKYELAYRSKVAPYVPEYPRTNGTTHEAIVARKPILIADVKKRQNAKSDAKSYMASAAIVPITYRNNTYGIFVLAYTKKHNFSKEEKDLATAIGNSAAQTITINRLYKDLKNFKNTLDNTRDGILIFDTQTLRIQYMNHGIISLLGKKRSALIKRSITHLMPGLKEQYLRNKMSEIIMHSELDFLVFETEFNHPVNGKVPLELSLQYIPENNQPDRFLVIVRDITERKQTENTIRKMAYYDQLTGLPNRSLLIERLAEAHEKAERKKNMYALLFIDLDRFKVINDIYGHDIGDLLLIQVAKRMQKAIPKKATLARMGGDEFLVLIPDLDTVDEAQRCANAVQDIFTDFYKLKDQEIYSNGSVGYAIYPLDGVDQSKLLKNADLALHRAKEHGGANVQQYSIGQPAFYTMQPQLQSQLRKAIKNNELVLHYQPIVDVKTKKVTCSEALVRWNHPELGLVMPGEFIGQAEESGVIVQIGQWVMEEVCRQIHEWEQFGKTALPVSFNISPRELLRPTLVSQLEDCLKRYKITQGKLKIELTETFLIKNIDLSVSILEQLKTLGVKILIDDFGTGYASLNYLKRMPIDYVKIDQTFVQGIPNNLQDAALTTAIITIAHHLGLEVVGEGVETKDQYSFLKQAKCNLAQGNFFSKPLTGEEFAKFLK